MDIEGIEDNQPAEELDLSDELSAAFDAAEEVEEAGEEASETGEVEASTDEATATEEAEETPEVEAITSPDHWSGDDKATFDGLSALGDEGRKAQEFLLNRHKAMEGDYTRKNQERSEAMRELEPLQKAFEPYAQALEAQGVTPAGKVQQWAQIEQSLSQNPVETLNWLAQQNGVNLDTMEVSQNNSELSGLRNELNQLRNSITEREQADQSSRLATVESQIGEFAEMKTEAGELAHPYFNDVMDDIVALASAERQAGREPELGALYEKAVWMNSSTRDKVMSSQRKAEEEKRQADARDKAAKAKHAASSVSGTPGGASPTSDLSLRDQLAQSFG